MADRPGFRFIVGTEGIALPAWMAGARGCVAGLANAFPEIMIELWELFQARKYAGSAATTLTEGELDWGYIAQAKWVELTGITPALSATCRATALSAVHCARSHGCKVAFDVNYRSLLWTEEEASATLREILPCVNLLVATEPDMAVLLGARLEHHEALRTAQGRYGLDAAVMTLGAEGYLAYDGRAFHEAPAHKVQVVNRLGAGDAFLAGLLYGCLCADLQSGLHYGMAMAALKMTIPQNTPMVNKEDVERLVGGRIRDLIR